MDPTPLPARPLNVELRALHVFAEVVRQGGFSRAAEAVHSTRSTVSKTVGRLEDEVGAPLLRRHSRGVELTAAGELVYRRAQAMLAQRELLTRDVQALTRRPRGTLRLGFSRMETSAFFARALTRYRHRYPEVELSVCADADGQLVQRLLRGELDAAGMVCPQESRLETLVLQREPLVVLLPRDHALARREHLGIEDLAGQPLVMFEDKCPLNDKTLQLYDRAGLTVRIALKTSQVGLILELVAEGLGVGFLPRSVVRNRPHARVAAIPLRGSENAWVLAAAWSRDSLQSQAMRTWIAVLRELYLAQGAELPEAA